MKRKESELTPGLSVTIEEIVTKEKSASSIGSGALEVYSTPSMIAFMEKASFMCVQQYLNEDESTVGGLVNIKHLKPTALGEKVICKSVITEVKGKKITFKVEIYEEKVLIGVGQHTRFVINKTAFMQSLKS